MYSTVRNDSDGLDGFIDLRAHCMGCDPAGSCLTVWLRIANDDSRQMPMPVTRHRHTVRRKHLHSLVRRAAPRASAIKHGSASGHGNGLRGGSGSRSETAPRSQAAASRCWPCPCATACWDSRLQLRQRRVAPQTARRKGYIGHRLRAQHLLLDWQPLQRSRTASAQWPPPAFRDEHRALATHGASQLDDTSIVKKDHRIGSSCETTVDGPSKSIVLVSYSTICVAASMSDAETR